MLRYIRQTSIIICLLVAVLFSHCGSARITGGAYGGKKLKDGEYIGYNKKFPNSAEVKVIISDGQIADIKILFHGAWRGKKAEPIITKRIIEIQSTKVDAVSGATNSSIVIMNAVDEAVRKALEE